MYIFLYRMCIRRFLFVTFVYIFIFPISDIYVRICTKSFKSAEFSFQYTCTCMSVFIIYANVSLFSAYNIFMLLYVRKAPRDFTSFFIARVYVCLRDIHHIHMSFFHYLIDICVFTCAKSLNSISVFFADNYFTLSYPHFIY